MNSGEAALAACGHASTKARKIRDRIDWPIRSLNGWHITSAKRNLLAETVKIHSVKVQPSKANLPKTAQLAWKIAQVAHDDAPIEPAIAEMVVNRVIDNAAVAMAAINRTPVANAR